MPTAEDYRRFLASAPEAVIEWRTIELYHPDFDEVVRFVANTRAVSLTLESDAPNNAGETVVFSPLAMRLRDPKERGNASGGVGVNVSDLSSEASEILRQITPENVFVPVRMIYRKFIDSDTSSPVYVRRLTVGGVVFDRDNSFSFEGDDTDFANKTGGQLYTLDRFPSLRSF